jgi:hypothetical protein
VQQDSRGRGDFSEAADDLGVEPISRSLARAKAQVLLRESAGEDERSIAFWRRRVENLTGALKQAQRQLRDDRGRARLAVTVIRFARRVAPRRRGAGRPGVRRRVASASGSGDPPGSDGEHHLVDLAGRRR